MNYREVKAVQDDSCHWYIIPNELSEEFFKDLADGDMCDDGQFDKKYSQYMTGGDLNNVQLYTRITQ